MRIGQDGGGASLKKKKKKSVLAEITFENWMNVIWSDETSVVLNHRRGGYRI
jgi:hypothetical protein